MTVHKYGATIRKLRAGVKASRYLDRMKPKWARIMLKRIKLNTGMKISEICNTLKCDRGNLSKALRGKRSFPMKLFCDLIDLDHKIFIQQGK